MDYDERNLQANYLARDYKDYKDGFLTRKEVVEYLRFYFPELKIYRSRLTWFLSLIGWLTWASLGNQILDKIINYLRG